MRKLSLSLIKQATKTLHQWFLRTPIEYSKPLSDLLGVPIIFKCEYLQPSGSFKLRGAYFSLSQLSSIQKKQGVSTCCKDNHAIALAYVANLLNTPCHIYLFQNTPSCSQKRLLNLHAKLHFSPFSCHYETLKWAKKQSTERGFHFVSAFENDIIAANGGSLAIEIMKDVPQVKNFILPVEQGDMISGLSYYVKKKFPDVTIIGCKRSELKEKLHPKIFSLLKERVDHISLHSEDAILEGMRWMIQHHQCLIEPSAAIVIAACLSGSLPPIEGPTVVVLSGKNISEDLLKQLL